MKGLIVLLCVTGSFLFMTGPASYAGEAAPQAITIVPPESRISDHEARLALARTLSYDRATLRDSLAEYRLLLAAAPDDNEISTEAALIFLQLKMFPEAAAIFRDVYRRDPANVTAAAALADVECARGHAKACRDLYLDALRTSGQRADLALRFADKMNMWGDFYKAESLYRRHLAGHPADLDVALKLAGTLASMQRYEESEHIYRTLILEGHKDAPILAGLAGTKLLEKDFTAAQRYARETLAIDPGSVDAARILADSLMFAGKYGDARSVYEKMGTGTDAPGTAFVNIGKTFLKENDAAQARRYFEKARLADPRNIPARFYEKWPQEVRSRAFLSSLVNDGELTAEALSEWAGLYLSNGLFDEAIECSRAALERDPRFFSASIMLAETLGINKGYEESIALHRELAREFPGDSRILIGLARVLAWSRRYDESLALYREVIDLNPADPVPRREMARTAMWARKPSLAMETYEAALFALTGKTSPDPPKDVKTTDMQGTLEPGRRIHRSIYLEKEAKRLAFDKKFTESLPVYETLLEENPGNEEALFDKAQVACSLGLCDLERQTYERLLTIDPLHTLAGDALEKQKSRSNPSARFDYSYWNEEGRGDLARITRNRFDITLDVPVQCQYRLFVKGHRWLEQPDFNHRTYGANGLSLGFAGVFNPFIKGEASWTHKRYDDSGLGSKDTGNAAAWFNIHDRVRLGAGYARTDELYNYFGIQEGIQADRLWAGFQSDITRKLEVGGKAEYIRYTDSNSGTFLGLSAGYAATDYPRIFKISASGEFRNTRHDNEYVYENGLLTNIIHPYWAPRDYAAGSIIFEWYHDLSKLFFCGAEQHFYNLKASFGTDSENNPYAKMEGEWNYEFARHWLVGIKGMVHSSPEWNATGAWAQLRYRF